MQAKVGEYEAEVERMSLVLETQKTAMSELEQSVKKNKDEMAREIQKKVCNMSLLLAGPVTNVIRWPRLTV